MGDFLVKSGALYILELEKFLPLDDGAIEEDDEDEDKEDKIKDDEDVDDEDEEEDDEEDEDSPKDGGEINE